jgi:hypothetical protein
VVLADGRPREVRPHPVAPFLLTVLFVVAPTPAHADWLFTPFVGSTFAGSTTFLVPETGTLTRKVIFGGSAAWLTESIVGLEADFAYIPHFFETNDPSGLVTGSSVLTLTGNAIVTVPLSLTREALRPYAVAGLGLIRAHSDDAGNVFPIEEGLVGFDVGGGAMGFITDRTGLRFDLRQFRVLQRAGTLTGGRAARVAFWRFTVGVTLRY